MPQIMMVTAGLESVSFNSLKLCSEAKLIESIHNSTRAPAIDIKPETRCVIETMAVMGNEIVEISRLTGRLFFTVAKRLFEVSRSCLVSTAETSNWIDAKVNDYAAL